MFALIFAIIEVIGNVIVEVLKKLFTMAILAFLTVASVITGIALLIIYAVR